MRYRRSGGNGLAHRFPTFGGGGNDLARATLAESVPGLRLCSVLRSLSAGRAPLGGFFDRNDPARADVHFTRPLALLLQSEIKTFTDAVKITELPDAEAELLFENSRYRSLALTMIFR